MQFLDILKKNIIMSVVILSCLIISSVLLFLVLRKTKEIRAYQDILSTNKTKIEDVRKQLTPSNPGPIKENVDAIKADSVKIKKKLDEVQLFFGKPYRKALQAFIAELGEKEMDVYEKWRENIKKGLKKKLSVTQALAENFKEYEPEKLDAAKAVFKEVLRNESIEYSKDKPFDNIDEYILESLGFNRDISSEDCTRYIEHMNSNLKKLLNPQNGVNSIATPPKFSPTVYANALPNKSQIPHIIKHYKLKEDLICRLKKANITNLESMDRTGAIDGIVDKNGYLYFNYKMTVKGSLSSIRELVNQMQDAYKDNRVYVIKNLSLLKDYDEVTKIEAPPSKESETPEEKDQNLFKPEVAVKPSEKKTTGKSPVDLPLIGGIGSDNVTAEIEFDYVIYLESEK